MPHVYFQIPILKYICILVLFFTAQQNVKAADNENQRHNTDLMELELTLLDSTDLPPYDFVVFMSQNRPLSTGIIDDTQLKAQMTIARVMSRIPPIHGIFYHEGFVVTEFYAGSIDFASDIKEITRKSKTFTRQSDQREGRRKIESRDNTYILEEESIGYNRVFSLVFIDKDVPSEERFYSKISDMRNSLYQGEHTAFFFRDKELLQELVTPDNHALQELEIYYEDPYKPIDGLIFTQEDSKRIFGREYLLMTPPRRNEHYVLTWLEYER